MLPDLTPPASRQGQLAARGIIAGLSAAPIHSTAQLHQEEIWYGAKKGLIGLWLRLRGQHEIKELRASELYGCSDVPWWCVFNSAQREKHRRNGKQRRKSCNPEACRSTWNVGSPPKLRQEGGTVVSSIPVTAAEPHEL